MPGEGRRKALGVGGRMRDVLMRCLAEVQHGRCARGGSALGAQPLDVGGGRPRHRPHRSRRSGLRPPPRRRSLGARGCAAEDPRAHRGGLGQQLGQLPGGLSPRRAGRTQPGCRPDAPGATETDFDEADAPDRAERRLGLGEAVLEREALWQHLGETPIRDVRLPRVQMRWRVEKPGFASILRVGSPGKANSKPALSSRRRTR